MAMLNNQRVIYDNMLYFFLACVECTLSPLSLLDPGNMWFSQLWKKLLFAACVSLRAHECLHSISAQNPLG